MTAWGSLPPALPAHGTVLAWVRGCRCDDCEGEHERFMFELALRGPVRLPAEPEPRKMDADTLARLEPAVSQSECPVCGALRHQRCRNLAFPQHFSPTHPERGNGRLSGNGVFASRASGGKPHQEPAGGTIGPAGRG